MENLVHESDKLLIEFNQSIFKDVFSDFLGMVFPNEMNLEDTDLVDDALRSGKYHFDPKDTEKIKQEMITVLRKYNRDPDEGVAYASIIAIGKQRKDIYKLRGDIKIED